MPDGPEKTQLLAIPRGLTIQPHDVDLVGRSGADGDHDLRTAAPLHCRLTPCPAGHAAAQGARAGGPLGPGAPWHGFQNTNIDRQREGVAIKPASPRNWRPYRYQIGTEPVRLGVTMSNGQ